MYKIYIFVHYFTRKHTLKTKKQGVNTIKVRYESLENKKKTLSYIN
jgi:phage-related protein